ncbi:DUF4126 family protein [Frigoribacterium faeni]|uniref:Putative membrane protein n=1 Tax=Frigoribacterium faeni TaxID=145483 RepID=A0A7W3JIU3_9MICO|nr:DUF4126 family protein [Frigoribacterium faeni]MBA8813571.1 putative membrane protein [Frigoribacterium faeni]BFF14838.1 hypothetical protein GCM10025699_61410 [Microbacterium flavescens]GEK84190.1 hypothetical protein FFA01_24990 [Frigoribacterium faeni]
MSTTRTLPPLARATLLGLLSGSRSATPLAVLALNHHAEEARGPWQRWRLFRSPLGRLASVAAGAGELVGDKLPATPSRVGLGPLFGRAVSGAVAGIAMSGTGRGGSPVAGAVVGAAGAVAGSWLFYLARKAVVEKSGLPDLAVALVEDAVAVSGSVAVVRSR